MPGVAIISTGGSIAMELDASGRRQPSLSGAQLFGARRDEVDYRFVDLYRMSSHNARAADWHLLARTVAEISSTGDSVIVTHGTDSMEEAAYFVAEVTANTPVVFVGAMIPPGAPGADGARNVQDAVVVAQHLRRYGTVICSAGEVFPAWAARKVDTSLVQGFGARHGGRVARVHNASVMLEAGPLTANWYGRLPPEPPIEKVALVDLGIDPSVTQFDCATAEAEGCVLQAIGYGSVPERLKPAVVAFARERPVVLTTRPFAGPVQGEQLYPGSWDVLLAGGVQIEDVLDSYKARLRLAVAIGLGQTYIPFTTSLASGD